MEGVDGRGGCTRNGRGSAIQNVNIGRIIGKQKQQS